MSFFEFLESKNILKIILRPEIILSKIYLRKCSVLSPPIIIKLSFFVNVKNLEKVGYIFRIFISV